jgi:hypothetical protein
VIVEGILTTENKDGSSNLAPMGPITDAAMQRLVLRPFNTSTTFHNLKRTRRAVFHISDDACLIARASIGAVESLPQLDPILVDGSPGFRMASACRWYGVRVDSIDESQPRTRMECTVVEHGTLRDFLGFQRARHALIELAILATRVHLIPRDQLARHLEILRPMVEKTGDPPEIATWELLEQFIRRRWAEAPHP